MGLIWIQIAILFPKTGFFYHFPQLIHINSQSTNIFFAKKNLTSVKKQDWTGFQ
jgi:hypothetical protein